MRLGIDIGGTFTDLVLVDSAGVVRTKKLLTTPDEPLTAMLDGMNALVDEAQTTFAELDLVVHGTTLVPNALIQQKGAVTALITTRGFRDVIEIGREWRYDIYDLFLAPPPLLVPRPLRFEVSERIDSNGAVLAPLDLAGLERVVNALPDNVQSVAVCFLNSYVNRSHELEAARHIARLRPDLFVTASSELSPEIREYERFSTAVANAYVQPLVKPYLDRFATSLKKAGVPNAPNIVLSNGGLTGIDDAARFPIRMVESGPSAGVVAASYFSKMLGEMEVLAFDMGGTTAKASFLSAGELNITRSFEVARAYRFKAGSGIPLNVTTVDLIEIGAGGGSIAWIDTLGRLKIGPESAGAAPGPACYGRGGERPTVTDADLLLGYLDADRFLGGAMPIDPRQAEQALRVHVGEKLGLAPLDAAWGVHRLVNDGMANAIRMHAAEHGREIGECTMIPFGGAAGIHACHVAEQLGIKKVISPMRGSVLSAFGMLVAPPAFDSVRTLPQRIELVDTAQVEQAFADMLDEGRAMMLASGVPISTLRTHRSCDVQFEGQGHALTIDLPPEKLDAGVLETLRKRFEQRYETLHRRLPVGVPIEATNWRLRVAGPEPDVKLPHGAPSTHADSEAIHRRQAYFGGGLSCEISVFLRAALRAGSVIEGPAVIEEPDTSIIIPSGWCATADRFLNVIIEKVRS
jgi:N-methylhydantoinase A